MYVYMQCTYCTFSTAALLQLIKAPILKEAGEKLPTTSMRIGKGLILAPKKFTLFMQFQILLSLSHTQSHSFSLCLCHSQFSHNSLSCIVLSISIEPLFFYFFVMRMRGIHMYIYIHIHTHICRFKLTLFKRALNSKMQKFILRLISSHARQKSACFFPLESI